jgi:hypothetical protein
MQGVFFFFFFFFFARFFLNYWKIADEIFFASLILVNTDKA